MPRRLFFILLFLSLALAACKSTSQTETATTNAGTTPVANATPKPASSFSLPEQASVPGCTVVSFMPTPDTTSLFPAITEDDHYKGSLTASVKIIEYSDFQ